MGCIQVLLLIMCLQRNTIGISQTEFVTEQVGVTIKNGCFITINILHKCKDIFYGFGARYILLVWILFCAWFFRRWV